jgi:hypothetical protein
MQMARITQQVAGRNSAKSQGPKASQPKNGRAKAKSYPALAAAQSAAVSCRHFAQVYFSLHV